MKKKQHTPSLFAKLIILLISLFIIYLVVLYAIQDFLVLHPDKKYIKSDYFTEKMIPMSDHTDVRLWISKGDPNQPLLLFFHGNRGQNFYLSEPMQLLIKDGYSIVMMEYRGFAEAPGHFSQDRIFQDAIEVYDWLAASGNNEIISYGYSLGTSVATYLASKRPVKGLILTAPFVSLHQLVGEMPVPFAQFILKNPLLSNEYAKFVEAPVLIIHGTKDPLIPYHHSKELYKYFTSDKTLELLENETHHSLYFDGHNIPAIRKWLSRHHTCSSNADCRQYGEGFYCQVDTQDCQTIKTGTCQKTQGLIKKEKIPYNNRHLTLSNQGLNWFSANNWCDAQGMKLVSLHDFNISQPKETCYFLSQSDKETYCDLTLDQEAQLRDIFGSQYYYWTRSSLNPCHAFGMCFINNYIRPLNKDSTLRHAVCIK